MPVNINPVIFTPAGGPETFVEIGGRVVRGKRGLAGRSHGYICHFATCPDADKLRQNKKIIEEEWG